MGKVNIIPFWNVWSNKKYRYVAPSAHVHVL